MAGNLSPKLVGHILDCSADVQGCLNEGPDGYAARLLVAVNLPYRDPGPKTVNWSRNNRSISLDITTGFRGGMPVGLPFGKYPRLLLMQLVTEAVRTKDPCIRLGNTLAEFMTAIGMQRGGKQVATLRDQMRRLFSAQFSWSFEAANGWAVENVQPVRRASLWWDPKDPNQPGLWDSTVELHTDFFTEIVTRPIPWRSSAINAVASSPLGLDLLLFLSWRTFRAAEGDPLPPEGVAISWEQLHAQMGGQYTGETGLKEFARGCKAQLARIKAVWPQLRFETPRGRLLLRQSEPLVRPR